MIRRIKETVEKASHRIWLKQEDESWFKYKKQNSITGKWYPDISEGGCTEQAVEAEGPKWCVSFSDDYVLHCQVSEARAGSTLQKFLQSW